MDPKFQSSFIPKGAIPSVGPRGAAIDRGERSFFGFISIIIFILVALLSGGILAYKYYLNSEIAKMGSNLTAASATLDPTSINQMVDLSARISSVQGLISHHVVLTPLFAFLESSTVSSIRLTDFNYSITDKKVLQVIIKGLANGYSDIALQSSVLSKTPYFKNIVFSNLTLNPQGKVSFTVSADVDPTLVSYQKSLAGLKVTLPTSITSTTTAATSTPITASTTPKKK